MSVSGKTVYLYSDRSRPAGDMLAELGFEVLTGDGKSYNEQYLSRCWALMSGRGYVTAQVLDRAPGLRLICKQGVGLDRIDLDECAKRGIKVVNTPNSNSVSVAEHTMALILGCAKQLYPLSRRIRTAEPEPGCVTRFRACELAGKILAVIGLGNIGLRVAKMACAFDMHVIACVRNTEKYASESWIELTDSIEYALSHADFVSVHVSGTEANRALIGQRELTLMKRDAVLINTTRGFVVDEQALYRALAAGEIGGAGLDVFENEPLSAGNPLLELDNVLATPHSAANTPEANMRAFEHCVKAIVEFAERED